MHATRFAFQRNRSRNFVKATRRTYSTQAGSSGGFLGKLFLFVGGAAVGGAALAYSTGNWPECIHPKVCSAKPVDYEAVRNDIKAAIDSNPKYDDGSFGPVLVRLAWHAAGTYDVNTRTGGSNGATMRFDPESLHGANAGLATARRLLDPIQNKYPGLSAADLWILAGCVAIEHMGGPKVEFRPGRVDRPNGSYCPPDGRLPDASQGASHVRQVFTRQGFTDQETVALIGAHCLGRCHTDRSGFEGPWTASPTMFSNDYFVQLLERKWTKRNWKGPEQYEDESKTLMMLPADLALLADPEYKKWVEIYAKDEAKFFTDFSKAFQKLLENGVSFEKKVCPYNPFASKE